MGRILSHYILFYIYLFFHGMIWSKHDSMVNSLLQLALLYSHISVETCLCTYRYIESLSKPPSVCITHNIPQTLERYVCTSGRTLVQFQIHTLGNTDLAGINYHYIIIHIYPQWYMYTHLPIISCGWNQVIQGTKGGDVRVYSLVQSRLHIFRIHLCFDDKYRL